MFADSRPLFSVALIVIAVLAGSLVATGEAKAGTIVLYEGNGGSQQPVARYSDRPGQSLRVNPNDEARSLRLYNVRRNTLIRIYDSRSGSTRDDYCEIRVKTPHQYYTLPSFEMPFFEDRYVRVRYHRHNGLDGKVSYMTIN